MKEFIDKLKVRLKKCSFSIDDSSHTIDIDVVDYNDAIEIIDELAKEYQQENNNTDYANIELYNFWQKHQWIPCSERLPDKEGTYLVTLKKWEIITFARFTDIKTNPHFNALVIAWMPLPQPYTEEQKELSTTWQQQTMNRFERVE